MNGILSSIVATMSNATARKRGLWTLLLSLLLVPAAFAGEGNVKLVLTGSDKNYLYASIVFGLFAIAYGLSLRSKLLQMSPGSEKMQSVGAAITEGAKAYLVQQIRAMAPVIGILIVVLYFLYHNIWTSAAFFAGVLASYFAGYVGMMMAVAGNMRTANAALTSYKKALEAAFQSGAVAGLMTVGVGLLGATLIILGAGDDAMHVLIGFGFGGSLAALFMRVGGGIFTKAADVGADLVGKVEAGIPEDDPRNPAVIADNVGDNVGDCAGMAADVFESYEVTLVAAIVLGAATSAVFDTHTWMRLILFALMARGIGIVASAIGIMLVKGSDDIDADPLKAISSKFYLSAGIAGVATLVLAAMMMKDVNTGTLVDLEPARRQAQIDIRNAYQDQIKSAGTKAPKDIFDTVAKSDVVKKYGLDGEQYKTILEMATGFNSAYGRQMDGGFDPNRASALRDVKAFHAVDMDSKEPTLSYAVAYADVSNTSAAGATPKVKSLGDFIKDAKFFKLKINAQGKDNVAWVGPVSEGDLKVMIDQSKVKQVNVTRLDDSPATLYANADGDIALGVEKVNDPTHPFDLTAQTNQIGIYKNSVEETKKAVAEPVPANRDSMMAKLQAVPALLYGMQHKNVEWWRFFACIAFGLIMAGAIEKLTDYYVSTHKKPTQEVAMVSSAGAAPMIIQGFAYAAESSVFMVFAIVFALIVPLALFPPAVYGSPILSFYGVALVGLGLLTTTGFVLAMDTFGPISDNAQGVFEMSGDGHDNEYGSKAVQRLDAAGNTTKALTKGFAIATAVVAAVALFHSYIEDAKLGSVGLRLDVPEIFLGLLIGGAAPFLFSASTINAVGRAAFQIINEVRRQFREDPGIMAGTSKPDYARCVAIVTAAAQKELIVPAILAITMPVAVAFGFGIGKESVMINGEMYNLTGAQALGGFLAGTILSGQLMAVLLANSGGMWDNAKKLVEDGLYGGKGSDAHKAAVVCDTVGDPFKDTAGPALNPLIKVMNLVALLMAPIIIKDYGNSTRIIVTVITVGLFAGSIWWSKRASMSSELAAAHSSTPGELPGGHAEADAPAKPKRTITVGDDEDDTEPKS